VRAVIVVERSVSDASWIPLCESVDLAVTSPEDGFAALPS